MAKPRLVLHIGTHKTGTTAIQRALASGRSAYLAQGILYPPTDREPWPELPKHCSVFAAAAKGDAVQAERERHWLKEQFDASGAHTLLLSEEGLSEPNARLPAFFEPMAAEFDIHVVCLLRRPDLFTESLYNQFVREAARREGRSILMFSRAKGLRDRLDYAGILQPWRALAACVTVADFDQEVRARPLLELFSTAARLPGLAPVDDRANSSPDMRFIQVLSRLNRQRLPYDLGSLMHAARGIEAEGHFARCRHLLGRQERLQMLADLAPALERLAAEHGLRFATEMPAGEAFGAAEDIDQAYLLELLARACSH